MTHARIPRTAFTGLLAAGLWLLSLPAAAQDTAADAPVAAALQTFQAAQDLDQLTAAVAQLRAASALPAAQKAQADRQLALSQEAVSRGHGGEARRALAQAAAILAGQAWSAREDYAASIAIDPSVLVVDPQAPVPAQVTQRYPAAWSGDEMPSLRVSVAAEKDAGEPHLLWSTQLPARDLAGEPLAVDLDLRGLRSGRYELRAELADQGQRLRAWTVPFVVVEHLERAGAELAARLEAVADHEAVAAVVRYPLDLARAVNGWRRRIPAGFDFDAALSRSRELLDALERGEDRLTRATGVQQRAYASEAGEILPFRLYVPERWDGRRALPLLVLLHADGEEADALFEAPQRLPLLRLAAQYQYIVVAPSGYRPQAAFGSAPARVLTRLGARPGIAPAAIGGLAERDVLDVIERVASEYGADRRRIYLYGTAGSGSSAWFLGSRYGNTFAALASCGVAPPITGIVLPKDLPALALIGGRDPNIRRQAVREAVQALRGRGLPVSRLEISDQSSQEACAAPPVRAFQFFGLHQRRLRAPEGSARADSVRTGHPDA